MTDQATPKFLVFLVTSLAFPEGEPDCYKLQAALARRGVSSSLVVWNDEDVPWREADVIAVRSTWDYQDDSEAFLAWSKKCDSRLIHGFEIFRWNTDKAYLLELQKLGVPIVPSCFITDPSMDTIDLSFQEPFVVKPVIGASGGGVEIVNLHTQWAPTDKGPWIFQPFVSSIFDEGETTVFVVAGRITGQLQKLPAQGQFMVHEERGGIIVPVPVSGEARQLANSTVTAVESILGTKILYARIDMLRYEGRLVISEVELTEPAMYFNVIEGQDEYFADMLLQVCNKLRQ